jgi:hypothetical protein
VARKARNFQKLQLFFELFAEDSQLNVYAGEVEVRPPTAPTTEPTERAGSAISTLTSCQRCVTL